MDSFPIQFCFSERGEQEFGCAPARKGNSRSLPFGDRIRQKRENIRGARIGSFLRAVQNAQIRRIARLAHGVFGSNSCTRAKAALKAGSTPINASSSVINAVTAGSPKL